MGSRDRFDVVDGGVQKVKVANRKRVGLNNRKIYLAVSFVVWRKLFIRLGRAIVSKLAMLSLKGN